MFLFSLSVVSLTHDTFTFLKTLNVPHFISFTRLSATSRLFLWDINHPLRCF